MKSAPHTRDDAKSGAPRQTQLMGKEEEILLFSRPERFSRQQGLFVSTVHLLYGTTTYLPLPYHIYVSVHQTHDRFLTEKGKPF